MKVGEIVHLPNATQNGPLCGKVSSLALSVECTMDVSVLSCVDCALALMDMQCQSNALLARRVGFLLDERGYAPASAPAPMPGFIRATMSDGSVIERGKKK